MGLTKSRTRRPEGPIVVLVGRKTKMKHGNVGEKEQYATKRVAQVILIMGYGHFVC